MRRRLATALALALAAGLALGGCSGSADPEPSPSPSTTDGGDGTEASPEDVAALDAVTIEGDTGAAPTVDFEKPFAVSAPVARIDTAGDGDTIEEGQMIAVDLLIVTGDDGTEVGSTWAEDVEQELLLGGVNDHPIFAETLAGQQVGVRAVFALPGGEATEASEEYPSRLMVLEVTGVRDILSRAEGTPVEPAAGLPVVTLADDGAPTIEIPEGTQKPTELVSQVLIEGDGPPVETGQTLIVNYRGVLFDDGTEFDASWGRGPFETPIGAGQVIPGWDEGLVGKTVGSQVLLVVPPDKGYGPEGTGGIPADATLVFVVDILDAR